METRALKLNGREYNPYQVAETKTVGNIPSTSKLMPGQKVWVVGQTPDGLLVIATTPAKKRSELPVPEMFVAPRFLS